MKKIFFLFYSAAFLFTSCNNAGDAEKAKTDSTATTIKADIKKDTSVKAMPDMAAMMKAWDEFKTPGINHKWMEKTNGNWEAEMSQWMDPAAPPEKSKATVSQSSTLGGRYVIGKYSGKTMGKPMQGMSIMGYDNAKKLFVSTWIDDLGTGIVRMTGTYDETTKTLNLKGYQTDPVTGKDTEIREEMTLIDDDSYSLTMYGTGMDGKEMKFMEGTFKRKK